MAKTPYPQVYLRDFLAGLFGPDTVDQVHVTHFNADPGLSASKWKGKRLGPTLSSLPPENNQYFCIAELKPGADRVIGGVEHHHMIIADDIGSKVQGEKILEVLSLFGEPTARIETSPGNQTWIWRLAVPVEAHDLERVAQLNAIRDYMKRMGLTDAGTADMVRYIRLPFGLNTKDKYQSPFDGSFPECYLAGWDPATDVTLTDLCEAAFGEGWGELIASGEHMALATQASLGPATWSASMDDPWVRMAGAVGLNPRPGPQGRINCDCPNMSSHTVKGDTGFAFLGGDLCECHHSACQGLKVPDFKRMISDLYSGLASLGALDPALPASPDSYLALCEFEAAGAALGMTTGQALEDAGRIAANQERIAQERADEEDRGFDALCDRFVYVTEADGFWDTKFDMMLTDAQLDKDGEVTQVVEHGSRGKNRASSRLLNAGSKLKRVVRMAYRPGNAGQMFVDEPGARGQLVPCLNTYVAPAIVRRVGGQPKSFLELLGFLYRDPAKQEFLLNSMAWHLQNGNDRLPLLFVLSGGQGIGKDELLKAFFRLYGPSNVASISADNFASGFNDWLVKRIVYMEEMRMNRRDYPRLKSLVGSGPMTVRINPKYGKAHDVSVAPSFWASTNDIDAIGIDADDRRVVVLFSDAVRVQDPALLGDPALPGSTAWFGRVIAGMAQEDGDLLDFLLSRDVTTWRPQVAPDFGDGAKDDMMLSAMSSAEATVADLFAGGGQFEGRFFVTIDEIENFLNAGNASGLVRNTLSNQAISRGMTMAGFTRSVSQPRLDGVRRRVWVRNGTPAVTNMRQAYEADRDAWERSRQQAAFGVQPGGSTPTTVPASAH